MRSEVFQVCVVDGVFEALPNALAVNFHAAMGLDEAAMAQVQADVRQRILRAFVARGHLEACDADDMAAHAHGGGFSVNAGVCIEAPDRAGLLACIYEVFPLTCAHCAGAGRGCPGHPGSTVQPRLPPQLPMKSTI